MMLEIFLLVLTFAPIVVGFFLMLLGILVKDDWMGLWGMVVLFASLFWIIAFVTVTSSVWEDINQPLVDRVCLEHGFEPGKNSNLFLPETIPIHCFRKIEGEKLYQEVCIRNGKALLEKC